MRIDTGMYLIGMEETSGRKATAVGKPAPEGFLAAASRLGVDPDEMHMVGDDLNNDVLAAQVIGMIGVLVRTGKFRQDTLDRWAADEFAMQPNHVIDSVADLPELLGLSYHVRGADSEPGVTAGHPFAGELPRGRQGEEPHPGQSVALARAPGGETATRAQGPADGAGAVRGV